MNSASKIEGNEFKEMATTALMLTFICLDDHVGKAERELLLRNWFVGWFEQIETIGIYY